jgi:hypothetical protein
MPAGYLTRRFALLLPLALAACGGENDEAFEPLRFNYLPPIQLNVASIAIEQRFVPSGVAPDVSGQDPAPPIATLRAMANDRLQAFGTANRAVFAVLDASMTQENDIIRGTFAVSLTIQADDGNQLGFAEARVESRHSGRIDDLRSVLYDMTKSMMNDMNVEFEYQIHRNLKTWLTSAVAPDTPVQQTPLDGSGAAAPAPVAPAPLDTGADVAPAPAPAPVPQDTPAYPPSYLQLPPDQAQ